METTPYWKRVWVIGSGRCSTVEHNTITSILHVCKDNLIDGITMYGRFTQESFAKCSEKAELKEYPNLSQLMYRISKALDLDACRTWSLFCNYLMFEFYGKIEDLHKITDFEVCVKSFIVNIWQFYTLERTFLLRFTHFIIENHRNTLFEFHEAYSTFVENVSYKVIQRSLFKQLSQLMNEVARFKLDGDINFKDVVERNNSERLEIILMLLSTMQHGVFEFAEFIEMFKLIKEMNSQSRHDSLGASNRKMLEDIRIAESALFIASFNSFWENKDAWYPYIQRIEELIQEALSFENGSVFLVTWAALLTTLPREPATVAHLHNANIYFQSSTEKRVFKLLSAIASNRMFKDSVAGDVMRDGVLKLLDTLLLNFDMQYIYKQEGITDILKEFLKLPKFVPLCIETSRGIKSLYYYASRSFPHDFSSLSVFMKSLWFADEHRERVLNYLCQLTTFTEKLSDVKEEQPKVHLGALVSEYEPKSISTISFPYGSRVFYSDQFNQTMLTIQGSYNYTTVLKHYVDSFVTGDVPHYLPMLKHGYSLLRDMLAYNWDVVYGNGEVQILVQLAMYLLMSYAAASKKDFDILNTTFSIMLEWFKHFPVQVMLPLEAKLFFPTIYPTKSIHSGFVDMQLSPSKLTTMFEEELYVKGTVELWNTYLQLIREAMRMKVYYDNLVVPGLLYLATSFPMMVHKIYMDDSTRGEATRQTLVVSSLKLVLDILQQDPEALDEENLKVHKKFMNLFLHSYKHTKALFQVFSCGNTKLHLILTQDMNWKDGPLFGTVAAIKSALSCVLAILRYISKYGNIEEHQVFERLLYDAEQPRTSVLKIIATYLDHSFDLEIPTIACSILTAFVMVCDNKSLIHTLELDNYQVQCMFLERLRDAAENASLKVAIVELVTICVAKQTSMTAAFFRKTAENNDISVIGLLNEFLLDIEKHPNMSFGPLHKALLDLCHRIWKTNSQNLLKRLIDEEKFWHPIMSVLLKPINAESLEDYLEPALQIFEIITIQLHNSHTLTKSFSDAFETILQASPQFVKMWIGRLITVTFRDAVPSGVGHLSRSVTYLTVVKHFMFAVKAVYSQYFKTAWQSTTILKRCIDALIQYFAQVKEEQVSVLWGEICMVLTNDSIITDTEEAKDIFSITILLSINLSKMYTLMHDNSKYTFLSLLSKILTKFKKFDFEPSMIKRFLSSLESVFIYEYDTTFLSFKKTMDYTKWVVLLCITRIFLEYDTENPDSFFIRVQYTKKLTQVMGFCVMYSLPGSVGLATATTLEIYAESPLYKHLYSLDLTDFYQQTLPLTDSILANNKILNGIVPEHLKNWWIIYAHVIRFNTIVLRKFKGLLVEHIFNFCSLHCLPLIDSLRSSTVIADSSNLQLTIEILRFVVLLTDYFNMWFLGDREVLDQIMGAVKETINAGIAVIVRPKILISVPYNPEATRLFADPAVSNEHLISVTNRYMEIIGLACKSFGQCNSPYYRLPNDLNGSEPNFNVFVEYDFRVPPVMNENDKVLTYGSLLCAMHFVCKILTQIHVPDKPKIIDFNAPGPSETFEASTVVESQENKTILVYPLFTKETPETMSAIHGLTTREELEFQAAWLKDLDPKLMMSMLLELGKFLAGQIFVTLMDQDVERNLMQYIRRELCSELLLFYDFVQKYVLEKNAPLERGERDLSGAADARVMATPHRAHHRMKTRTPDKGAKPAPVGTDGSHPPLVVDVTAVCSGKPSGKKTVLTERQERNLIGLVHWFRHKCRLIHYSKFEEFLSQWHAKSTYIMPHSTYIKNTSVLINPEHEPHI